jgi:dTDP-4-dehydrorhamnose 3,5-epimerase
MEFKLNRIGGLVEIFPKLWGDARGVFFESFRKELFAENGINLDFVQDNQSFSEKGVLRGLHMQHEPHAQGKLVRVITGKVMDVVVDIRKDSPTFGQHEKFILDSKINNMLYVPPGFLHGFLTLEDAIFSYKCTDYYNKACESGVKFDDPTLGIDWGISNPNVSDKDMNLIGFEEFVKSLF